MEIRHRLACLVRAEWCVQHNHRVAPKENTPKKKGKISRERDKFQVRRIERQGSDIYNMYQKRSLVWKPTWCPHIPCWLANLHTQHHMLLIQQCCHWTCGAACCRIASCLYPTRRLQPSRKDCRVMQTSSRQRCREYGRPSWRFS